MTTDVARWVLTAGATGIFTALIFGRALLQHGHIEAGRRVYWTGWTVGAPLFLLATWGDLIRTLGMAALWAAIAVGFAYLVTPYLKIGGRVYAPGFIRRRYAPPEHTTNST